MKKVVILLSLLVASLFGTVHADDRAIRNSLTKLGIEAQEIKPSPIDNLKMVITSDSVFYATTDGKYIFQTAIYDVSGNHPVNITNRELVSGIDKLENEMIIFKANNEQYVVTVFTDPSCTFCVRMQNEMDEYNKLGITIRYLAFPRQGLNSREAKELESIWCAADPKTAFSRAIKGQTVPPASCAIDIERHYNLAAQLGINGTPTIIYQGAIMPGYVPPQQLKSMLDTYSAK